MLWHRWKLNRHFLTTALVFLAVEGSFVSGIKPETAVRALDPSQCIDCDNGSISGGSGSRVPLPDLIVVRK